MASLNDLIASDRERGFEEFVRAYQHRVFAYALAITGHHDAADDIAQESFLRVHRAFGRYPTERIRELPLTRWMFKITLNVARNHARSRRSRARLYDSERRDMLTRPLLAPGADEEAEKKRVQREVARFIAMLPPHHAEAVTLRWVMDLSYQQASEVLGRPVGTVKSDVHRGLAGLRRLIQEHNRGMEI